VNRKKLKKKLSEIKKRLLNMQSKQRRKKLTMMSVNAIVKLNKSGLKMKDG
jgi:hypothetical protein